MRIRLLIGVSLFAGLLASASAQITLASFDFQSDTIGNVAAGWTSGSDIFKVAANPSQSGINTSTQVVTWTSVNSLDRTVVNLTGYTSGYTFTLAFDLYDPDSTNDHGVLTGYGSIGINSADAWPIGATLTNSGATMFDDLSATGAWQHFSFDFTSSVSTYLTDHPGQAASFAIVFDETIYGSGARASIDNIIFTTTAIPEPSTCAALAGLAALGIVALRRRRAP